MLLLMAFCGQEQQIGINFVINAPLNVCHLWSVSCYWQLILDEAVKYLSQLSNVKTHESTKIHYWIVVNANNVKIQYMKHTWKCQIRTTFDFAIHIQRSDVRSYIISYIQLLRNIKDFDRLIHFVWMILQFGQNYKVEYLTYHVEVLLFSN